MTLYLFLLFIIIILNSFFVIISKNIITSIINLISIFISVALSLILIGAEFLGVLFIIIYVGAILILFLFVIMLLNLRIVEVYNASINKMSTGILFGVYFFIIFFIISHENFYLQFFYNDNNLTNLNTFQFQLIDSNTNLELLGDSFFNIYDFFIIYVGILLLLAMIGAMHISLNFYADNYVNKTSTILSLNVLKARVGYFALPERESIKKNYQNLI